MFSGFIPVVKELAKGAVMLFGWLLKKIASVFAPVIKPVIKQLYTGRILQDVKRPEWTLNGAKQSHKVRFHPFTSRF